MAKQREDGISWTDETWNPVRGCSRVSSGCENCYAERMSARFSGPGQPYVGLTRMTQGGPRWTGEIRLVPEALDQPLRWKKPRRIFVNSMSDLFHEGVPTEFIDQIFAVMALAPQHSYQVLTKRPARMYSYLETGECCTRWRRALASSLRAVGPERFPERLHPLPNLQLGVSVENQPTAEERIPSLLKTPAAVRFVSYEPALGAIDFGPWMGETTCQKREDKRHCEHWYDGDRPCCACGQTTGLDWVIAGGESGPGARPSHPDWFRQVRDSCVAAGVPFHFKQWGAWVPGYSHNPDRQIVRSTPGVGDDNWVWMQKVDKKAAGRLLDGREWQEFPEG